MVSYQNHRANLVEVAGFEPAAFWSRTKRATKLRYTSVTGANEGTRTPDLLITNQLLYRLSYIGIFSICYCIIRYRFCPVPKKSFFDARFGVCQGLGGSVSVRISTPASLTIDSR